MIRIFLSLSILFLTSQMLHAAPSQLDHLKGPVMAHLLEVVDGDTIRVKAQIWLGQELEIFVRFRNIDTPEIRRSSCNMEKDLALAAKDYLKKLIGNRPLALRDISPDRYAGRVLATVFTDDWLDLSDHLLKEKIARPYKRGGHDWCS